MKKGIKQDEQELVQTSNFKVLTLSTKLQLIWLLNYMYFTILNITQAFQENSRTAMVLPDLYCKPTWKPTGFSVKSSQCEKQHITK